eukprot:5205565-Pyramimonas_sp.AAC.1
MKACDLIREHALVEQMEPLSIEEIRTALSKMKPLAGQGVDKLSPLDFSLLPDQAIQDLSE